MTTVEGILKNIRDLLKEVWGAIVTSYTALASIIKAAASTYTAGDKGVMFLGVRNDAQTVLAVDGAYTPISTNDKGELYVAGTSATSSATPNYYIGAGQDGIATYTSNVSITTSATPFTVDDANCFVALIMYKPSGGQWQQAIINGVDGVSITASSNVITVSGGGTPFASGDTYLIGVVYQEKGYDSSTSSDLVSILNPNPNHRTDALPLISAAQTLTGTAATIGTSIPTATYNYLTVIMTYVKDTSTDLRLRFLGKGENGGQEAPLNASFVTISGVAVTYSATVANSYFEADEDANCVIIARIALDNSLGEVEIEGWVGTLGGTPQITVAKYLLGY